MARAEGLKQPWTLTESPPPCLPVIVQLPHWPSHAQDLRSLPDLAGSIGFDKYRNGNSAVTVSAWYPAVATPHVRQSLANAQRPEYF